mgnify:CR=1 FL=1
MKSPLNSRLAALFQNLILCVVVTVVGLALAEGFLHLLKSDQRRINHRDFYEPDPLLGWKKKAGTQRSIRTAEFSSNETVNSRGLRGKEYPYEKPPGEFRILILGDSFAEGYTVNEEDLFSELLKQMLNNNINNRLLYEVINAGTVGYATDQELLFFETEGKKYAPDLVLLMFYENDVLENISITEMYSKYKPLFRLVNDQLILEKAPSDDSGRGQMALEKSRERPSLKSRLQRLLLFRSANELLIRLGLLSAHNEVEDSQKRYFQVLAIRDTPEVEYAWLLTDRLLRRLKDAVSEIEAKLVVFYIPSVYALDDRVWLDTSRRFGLELGEWDLKKPEMRLGMVCQDLKIPFMSIGDIFRSRAPELGQGPSCFYHIGDGHWNKLGHRQVAEALFDFLARINALVPAASLSTNGLVK